MRIEGQTYIVSRSVIDKTAHIGRTEGVLPTINDLPKRLRDNPIGPKIPVKPEEFHDIVNELTDRGALIDVTVGGNGGNAAHRKKEWKSPDDPPIVIRTWAGSDGYRTLLHTDLNQPGIDPDIIEYEGVTPNAFVIPLLTPDGRKDRMLFSVHPKGLPSEFASGIPENTGYAVINSLGGDNWAQSLREGTAALKGRDIPYVYTPGSLQLDAVATNKREKFAVYDAIDGASALSVNKEELEELIMGKGVEPSKDIRTLLDQGLDLGAKHIFATDGDQGAYGASQDGSRLKVATTEVEQVVSLVGAGDAFMAGSTYQLFNSTDRHLGRTLQWGSVSGSFAVETIGAHTDPPSREAVENRLRDKQPKVIDLYAA